MEVSASEVPGGQELISTIASLTGLPVPIVEKELEEIVKNSGHAPASVTMDELRAAMIVYLESLQHELMAHGTETSTTNS